MSTIGVAYHNETIYRILYKDPPPRPKSPMFRSEREKLLKCQMGCIPQTHFTMGPAEETLKAPCQYLRKGEGVPRKEKKVLKECCLYKNIEDKIKKQNKDKPVDKVEEKAKANPKKKTNNAKKREELVRKMRLTNLKLVDTEKGHKINLLKNEWVFCDDFGKVPEYVRSRKAEWQKLEDDYRRELENQEPLCKPVSVEERQQVLNGLKYNYTQLQKEFLLLPMMIDTIPKVNRKTKLESDLRQMEKDVTLIEENPYIYIYD